MNKINLLPMAGINNVGRDEALQVRGDAPRIYLREAVNVDISPNGKPRMRDGLRNVTSTPLANLWQSPLHGDIFATLGDQWVKVDPTDWSTQPLATIGEGQVSHMVLNNAVLAAGPAGIFTFGGTHAQRMTIDTPPPPMVTGGAGALEAGSYGVAVSWLRNGMESPPSAITHCTLAGGGGLDVILPMCMDATVTHARLYFTRHNGGELARGEDYPIGLSVVAVPLLPKLGGPPQFWRMDAMPTGLYLGYWRGRLLTARANVLRFSEAMAYHIHDQRHGYVQMPQRITFVQPVDAGIWVGQVDHVAFLQGASPESLELQAKATKAPVPGSAIKVKAEVLGEMAGGGSECAVWLAENGYVVGTAGGAVVEPMAKVMKGVRASAGATVVFGDRLLTAVT